MRLVATFLATLIGASTLCVGLAHADRAAQRAQAQKLFKDGNRKEAFDLLKGLCLDPEAPPVEVVADLNLGSQCLNYLRRLSELDGFRESVAERHGDWRVQWAVAKTYQGYTHWGYMVAGEFHRGRRRGGGMRHNVWERDRVRSLQLLRSAYTHLKQNGPSDANERQQAARFYLDFANSLMLHRGSRQSWRLQYLSDLSALPDVEPGYGGYYGGGPAGAPVDAEGKPVFHELPKGFEAATTDGQRWRWLLVQAMELDDACRKLALRALADFSLSQFGVQTMAQYGRYLSVPGEGDESGPLAVHTLKDSETIAKLAVGIRRFLLPKDYQFIAIYKELGAHDVLGQLYENRRQYPKAAEQWKLAGRSERVSQITGNWGQFDYARGEAAGSGGELSYRYRNGKQVSFTAHRVKVRELMKDVKAYIRSNPPRLSWRNVRPEQIGYRIVREGEGKYLGEQVAQWQLELKPLKDHFDRQITIKHPLQQAGCYLVSARMQDGNFSRVLLWVSDTVLVKKALDGGVLYFVADARTGKPVPKAQVECFGYRQQWDRTARRYHVTTSEFTRVADGDGLLALTQNEMSRQFSWMVSATGAGQGGDRLAWLGFQGVWYGRRYDAEYRAKKVFTVTDRPVYRPGHQAKYKLWVRQAQYDMKDDESRFAGKSFTLRLVNPRGQKVSDTSVTCDAFGGIAGEWDVPKDATLGNYRLMLYEGGRRISYSSFRVEEYKKPEFEVTVEAPSKPVALGEKVEAKIAARYYFGAPVTKATVKYKVLRYTHDDRWFPARRWDWLFGNGYWWFAYEYGWYPGFGKWGCRRPMWSWWGRRHTPPEVVASGEAQIGADGTMTLPIDTAPAKLMHGDLDHRYEVTAEVRDASRRTIVGTGRVLVARKPFKVYGWTDRGHYRAGDTVTAYFAARRLDGKAVTGEGKLRLLQVTYDEQGKPQEKAVQSWDVATDAEGRMRQQLVASKAGQYRLSYTVDDGNGHTIEGGYVFVARGEGDDGRKYRFTHLEVVADKAEYRPGDTAKLLINTDQAESTVLFFPRASNGACLPPRVLSLTGKSLEVETAITMKEMPNFFVEALTVSNGKVHTEIRQLVVPPAERVLDVKVTPSKPEYEPGEEATLDVEITDPDGKPVQGQTTIAVYDKSLEYISGGSNVGEIKSFYWQWRRSHSPQTQHSLGRGSGVLLRQNEQGMRTLGVFGHMGAPQELKRQAEAQSGGEWGARESANNETFDMDKGDAPARSDAAPSSRARRGGKAAQGFAREELAEKVSDRLGVGGGGGGGGAAKTVEPKVRTKFADTAFWAASVLTDAQGKARVTFKMPENLTGWSMKVWAMGHGTRVGHGSASAVTKKKLLLRMQSPRFFTERDQVVLSANVHSYLKSPKPTKVVLELDGPVLALSKGEQAERVVTIKPGEEARVDWKVDVMREGTAVVRMKALTDVESDAAQMTFPAYVHGMSKQVARSSVIAPETDRTSMTFEIPAQRRVDDSKLTVRFSPTLAGAMVDALPYLASYPYGCTEQTLSRFLPTVMTQRVLQRMKIDLAAVKAKKINLNAQELGDAKERAQQWKRYPKVNPVWDEAKVDDMVADGIARLKAMQCSDGGWGWFSGYGERSWPHTTAYVVHGLQLSAENDVELPKGMLERGLAWLSRYRSQQIQMLKNAPTRTRPWKEHADNLDAFVQMVLLDAKQNAVEMRDFLYRDRNHLSVYGKAMLGLALDREGESQHEKRAMVIRNIEQFLVEDGENQTAYLKLPNEGYWWSWYGSEFEAHAYYLKLLCRTAPKSGKARGLVKYLLNNRKHATYWKSTRDTAIVLESFAEYLKASGEDQATMTVDVLVNGRKHKTVSFAPQTLFETDNTVELVGDAVETGEVKVELVRTSGSGPLYCNAYASFFTLEDHIAATGLEIKVHRNVYKLVRADKTEKVAGDRGQVGEQRVERYERRKLDNLSELTSGDLVEVELVIESKNDYEYLCFEDMKAAGFEPFQVRSGYTRGSGGGSLGAYMELRDEKVCFFVRRLARGKHSISYRLRAEIPGRFAALPTRGYAMYAPELKANSDEIKLVINDAPLPGEQK